MDRDITKDYKTAAYNREILASRATVKVSDNILNEFDKRVNFPKLKQNTKARRIIYDNKKERLHIIQLGSHISSAQTKKYYPRELIEGNDIVVEKVLNFS